MRLRGRIRGRALALIAAFFLTACAQLPGFAPERPGVLAFTQAPAAFRLEGRVSVKSGDESFSGGMIWRRARADEELLLRTPLGQGVAELRRGAAGVELKDAEGRVRHALDADTLLREALGVGMPLNGLAWWVVGHPRPDAAYQATPDTAGRLAALDQDGWHIEFSRYALQGGMSLPGKLVARHGDDLEVRLVVDVWELP